MVSKLYLRYEQQPSFGVIASSNAPILFDPTGAQVYAPQLESIGLIHCKQGIQLARLCDQRSFTAHVTAIAQSPSGSHLAAGYSDGSIRIWDPRSKECSITFNGHKSAVTCLAFDALGTRLASGSNDTDIVLWDLIAESGLFRLRGHKDKVTCLKFMSRDYMDHLVSSSKDSLVKFWDLSTKCCVENLVMHRGEVWTFDLLDRGDGMTLFTGASDGVIRVWKIDTGALSKKLDLSSNSKDELNSAASLIGTIERLSKERILSLKVLQSESVFAVQGADRLVEIYRVRTETEIQKKLDKKRRKTPDVELDESSLPMSDRFPKISMIRCGSKVTSFDLIQCLSAGTGKQGSIKFACSLSNNSIEMHELSSVRVTKGEQPTRLLNVIDFLGHRSDIRAVALSSDDELIATGSSDLLKVWFVRTKQCLKTMESGYVLCLAFLPGNKQIVVGTKTGELQLFDLASSSMIECIQAHDGPIWSLQVRSDKAGLITGSQDKVVKMWDFRMKRDAEFSELAERTTLVHVRTLKMSDDVLFVKQSPDGRFLAVALLDCTVKVFYYDTLKFSLSLYGHKLPVIAMDISFDSQQIATASSDKSVKIWGLDFGDCHKSLPSHEDSVTACQYVWGTHYLFTASKDKTIKYWDTDKFEQIMKLEGHHGEVWALAVAKYGSLVVSGSHDRSIRIWDKTNDQFTVEEERERELELQYEKQQSLDASRDEQPIGSGAGDDSMNHQAIVEIGAPNTTTADMLKSGEKIMDALIIWKKEREDLDKYEKLRVNNPSLAPPPRSPFIIATGKPDMLPEEYVLHVVEQIRSTQLDEALLVLPFSQVISLLVCVSFWVEKEWKIRLSCRILFSLLQIHHREMVSTKALKNTLEKIRNSVRCNLQKEKDKIGYSLASLQFLLREHEAQKTSSFFVGDDEEKVLSDKTKSKRKRQLKVVS